MLICTSLTQTPLSLTHMRTIFIDSHDSHDSHED
jgi:hypothetical protein